MTSVGNAGHINQDNRGPYVPHMSHVSGGLWDMIEENGRNRVYLRVHWVFDVFSVHNNGTLDFDPKY